MTKTKAPDQQPTEPPFEAHITVSSQATGWGGSSAVGFQSFTAALDDTIWKTSIFAEDNVDGQTGNWFAIARATTEAELRSFCAEAVDHLTTSGYEVLRVKIERTVFDTKAGDDIFEILDDAD